jgi:hypothetical protein
MSDPPPPSALRTLARAIYLAAPALLMVGSVATIQYYSILDGASALAIIAAAPAGHVLLTLALYARVLEPRFFLWAPFAAAILQLVALDAADRLDIIYGGQCDIAPVIFSLFLCWLVFLATFVVARAGARPKRNP